LMNMVEVAYQLRGLVDYIVASEEVEPGDGWPYDKVMADLKSRPATDPSKVSRDIVKRYLASYTAAAGVTDSAVDVGRVASLAKAVDQLASVTIASLGSDPDYAAFGKAVKAAQRFETKDFVDLGNLCDEIIARSARAEVQQAARDVMQCLNGGSPFVLVEGHKGKDVAKATGTSIYFPLVGDVSVGYDRLDFAKDTRWGELIKKYQQM
jgi:hypothetical protein